MSYRSFDENKFNEAIEKNDYEYIKTCVISAIRNNPGFYGRQQGEKQCEAVRAFEKAMNSCFGIREEYQLQEGEVEFNEKDRDKWDKEYFIRQTFLLGRNFCEKRFLDIMKIGKEITPKPNSNFQEPQERNQIPDTGINDTESEHKLEKPLPTGKLLIAAIIVLLVVLVAIFAAIALQAEKMEISTLALQLLSQRFA